MNPHSIIRILFVIVFSFIYLLTFSAATNYVTTQSGQKISVEIADTEDDRAKGLSGRTELADSSGMLFVFEEGQAKCFWMKNTYIPLDMVWLDAEKKVVFVHEMAKPESLDPICPNIKSTYVLEVKGGKSQELGLLLGETVNW